MTTLKPPKLNASVLSRYFSWYLNIKSWSKFIPTLKQTNAQSCSTQCVSEWHWSWIFLRQPPICKLSEALTKSNHFSVAGFYCHFKRIHSWSISYPQSSSELWIYFPFLTVIYLRLRFLPLMPIRFTWGALNTRVPGAHFWGVWFTGAVVETALGICHLWFPCKAQVQTYY